MILPNTLQPSDTVALLAASSPLAPDHRRLVPMAVLVLQSWACRSTSSQTWTPCTGIWLARDHQRALYVQRFDTDPTIKAARSLPAGAMAPHGCSDTWMMT